MAGLYFHIPFCKQACYYCDFHFSTNQEVRAEMVKALVKELHLQKDFLNGEVINTVYIGGGTPSLLKFEELHSLLDAVRNLHQLNSTAEITLEANPDDLTDDTLTKVKQVGINRLSIGIQTFHNDLLKFMNRAHDSATALQAIQSARKAGFDNISIDLIYAIPGQDDVRWKEDIQQALEVNPEHLSCYSLTIEEKTVFGKWSAIGKLKTVEDDVAAYLLEVLMGTLSAAGYEHYEISNFAKPGFYSRHNSSYWKQQKYLGIGPSAHSYNGSIRQFNIANNHLYLKSIQKNEIPAEKEVLTIENKINEYILTTLRTQWGTDLTKLKQEFNVDLLQQNSAYIQQLIERDQAILANGVLILTRKGKLLADKLASDLFVEKK
ncbi:MAG: radical SAM family heme chaperone HemW [Cyclobacteriaceae bacterium]|nr:radical SAM family heme chaperone HemW [Cyclobacteriaceae bacterium]